MDNLCKKIGALLLIIAMCFSFCSCGKREKLVELTTDNIYNYLAFSKDVSGGSVEKTNKSILGISFVLYKGTGEYILTANRNDNVGFKDVVVEIDLIVGDGRTREEWKFASGGKNELRYSDDIGRYVKRVSMNISYDGTGSVSEDMVLDISVSAVSSVLHSAPIELSKDVSYNIVSVSGHVVISN